MKRSWSRRDLFQLAPGAVTLTGALSVLSHPSYAVEASAVLPDVPSASPPWATFPREDLSLVSKVVGLAHRDEAGVKELVKAHPALVNAWWDWGFGDWESALGAASHVGERGIAEFLIERGARVDIFAAAMLGMTDVVKAFVAAQPGVQRNLGPHGIPLLAHAEAGGEKAADTFAYLQSLGDAGKGFEVKPLEEARRDLFVGKYVSEDGAIRTECRANRNGRLVMDIDAGATKTTGQLMHYVGEDAFFPSGVNSVRFQFAVEGTIAQTLTIRAKEFAIVAKRV